MQLPQNLKEFTVNDLKALAFDNIVEIENNQNNLREINLLIGAKRILFPTPDMPPNG